LAPLQRNSTFADFIEDTPTAVKWHAAAHTDYILSLMSPLHRKKVADASARGRRMVGAVYRRTRPDENGNKRQRAEVRFDDVAGCSSRQIILVVEGKTVRSRLLSPREAARLMGLDDDYRLPERYNHAYHVCGDGVSAPVVRHIAQHVLEPALVDHGRSELIAAE
jgi:DNA (cytosine-5)-methyltransferase 1